MYLINFCGETLTACNGSAACMQPFFSVDNYISLGLYETQMVQDLPNDGWAGLTLVYTNGSDCPELPGYQRNITVNVRCAYNQPTKFLDAYQDLDCAFTAFFTSGAACPTNCPEGKRGGNCTTCLEDYWGPTCQPCQCEFGACNSTDGSCSCQKGWSGKDCDTCAPSRCIFNASNIFLYNVTSLADVDTDYHFIDMQEEYWVNILARTVFPCDGIETPVCQKTVNGTYVSLGSLETETIQSLGGGGGITVSYTNGSKCPGVPGTTLSVNINVYCVTGAPTSVVSVELLESCSYYIEMNSGIACPQCTPGRFGGDCSPCQCTNSISCNDGFDGNGTCNCMTGFLGDQCDSCEKGYWGSSCKACECDMDHSLCLDGAEGSGNCICFAGYGGDNCSKKETEADNSQLWTYAGVGLAIGVIAGVGAAVGACMYLRSKKREYEAVKG